MYLILLVEKGGGDSNTCDNNTSNNSNNNINNNKNTVTKDTRKF